MSAARAVALLRWVDLGAGGWEAELDGGARRPVTGPIPAGLRAGDRVEVAEDTESHGFLMTGAPAVRVLGPAR